MKITLSILVFLFSSSVVAEELKTYKCVSASYCYVVESNNLISRYARGETTMRTESEMKGNYDSISDVWEEVKTEEELEIKKKISILKVLLDEGEITEQQYQKLKIIVISYQLTGNSNNTEEIDEENKILKDLLNEMKKQTNIQSNESTMRSLCILFKSMRGINSVFNSCL